MPRKFLITNFVFWAHFPESLEKAAGLEVAEEAHVSNSHRGLVPYPYCQTLAVPLIMLLVLEVLAGVVAEVVQAGTRPGPH